MYLCIDVSMYLCIYVSMYLCMHACMYACMYESMKHHETSINEQNVTCWTCLFGRWCISCSPVRCPMNSMVDLSIVMSTFTRSGNQITRVSVRIIEGTPTKKYWWFTGFYFLGEYWLDSFEFWVLKKPYLRSTNHRSLCTGDVNMKHGEKLKVFIQQTVNSSWPNWSNLEIRPNMAIGDGLANPHCYKVLESFPRTLLWTLRNLLSFLHKAGSLFYTYII